MRLAPVALVVAVLASRAVAAILAPVSDDLLAWRQVAAVLERGGDPYAETGRLNWPPLWMLWIGVAGGAARLGGLPFDACVRLLPCAADAVTSLLLARISVPLALTFALHPVALTTTGAQAQFDAVPALLALVAALLVEPRAPGRDALAGLALGLGAGFKTWPLFLAPALAMRLPDARSRLRFLAPALALPGLLVLPVALLSPVSFRRDVLAYASQPGWWGLTSLYILFPSGPTQAVADFAARHGRAVLLAVLLLAWASARRLAAREAALATLLAFLVATPGFGPQYLLWAVPLALLERGPVPLAWHLLASAALLLEFYLLPHLPPDPTLTRGEASVLGNHLINVLRLPAYAASCGWFGLLLRRGLTRR